ncbi:MAG: hypothetical protein ACRD2X_09040 [Vicinamibacteraceae bacterium]
MPAIGGAKTFDTLHRGGLASAVRPYQPEYLTRLHLERDFVYGHHRAIRLPDCHNLDHRTVCHAQQAFCHALPGSMTGETS